MAAQKRLQAEIDKLLKKVDEGRVPHDFRGGLEMMKGEREGTKLPLAEMIEMIILSIFIFVGEHVERTQFRPKT